MCNTASLTVETKSRINSSPHLLCTNPSPRVAACITINIDREKYHHKALNLDSHDQIRMEQA